MSADNSPEAPVLSKAERLAIGGAVAPIVRTARARPVTLVGKDGKPVGVTTSVEVAKSLLARSEIEFSVQDGTRPAFVNCRKCGRPVPVRGKSGTLPTQCATGTHKCACGVPIRTYGCGFGRTCRECARLRPVSTEQRRKMSESMRATLAALTPEQRSERARRTSRSKTPEQRAEAGRRGAAAMLAATTRERRRENAKKANAAAMSKMTPAERVARSALMREAIAPEQRREASVKGGTKAAQKRARMTPEQRSEIARKSSATRAKRRALTNIGDVSVANCARSN